MKLYSFARLTALLLVLLVACSRSKVQSTSGYPETMSVWLRWETDPAKFQALFEEFGETHDTVVEVALRVHAEKRENGVRSDDPPDVLILTPSQMVDMANQGLLTPLDDVIDAGGIAFEDIYPAALQLCNYEGQLYCMPWSVYTLALFWNKDLFRAAGLNANQPPQTLEQLATYAGRLTQVDEMGNVIQLGFLPDYPSSHRELYPHVFGGYWYNADATRLTLSSEPVIEAMTWQQQFYADYETEKVAAFRSTLGHYASPEHALLTGKVAMAVDGQWMLGPDFIQKHKPDLNFGVAPVPYPQDHPERKNTSVVMGSVAVIPVGVEDVEAAVELLAWMLRPEFQAEFNCQTYNLPVSIQAASAPCFRADKKFSMFMDLMASPNAHGQVVSAISGELTPELMQIEASVLYEQADPVPLLNEAQAKLQPILDEALRAASEGE